MSNRNKGIVLTLATAFISGFSIFINGFSVKMIDPSVFTFLKNGLVALTLFAVILGASQFKQLSALKAKQWFYLVLVGLIGGCIPFFLFFNGLAITGSAAGSFVHKTMFLFTALGAAYFLKEKLSPKILLAAVILLVGNLLILQADMKNLGIGHLMILIAVLFWTAENILSKHLLKDMNGNVLAFGRMFFGSVFMLGWLGFSGQLGPITALSASQWLWTAIPAALLLGYVVSWYNGLKYIPVSLATVILLIGSPVTTLLNLAVLQQPATLNQWAGIICIASGALIWFWQNGQKPQNSAKLSPAG